MTRFNKLVFAVLLCITSPASLAQERSRFYAGEELFRTAGGYGCSTCHGMFAQGGGNVGGNIRGTTLEDINTRLNNEPTMQLLADALSTEQRELLAFYLGEMGKLQLVEWIIEDKPTEATITIEAEKPSQLVIFNKRFEPVSLTLLSVNPQEKVQINPYETKAYEWKPESGTTQLTYMQNTLTIQIK